MIANHAGANRVLSNVPFIEYVNQRRVNWHTLVNFRRSALHGRHAMLLPKDSSEWMVLGGAIDCAIFEPEKFAREYAVRPVFDGHPNSNAHKAAKKEWEAANANAIHLTRGEMQDVQDMLGALKANHRAWGLLTGGKGRAQLTLNWTDPETEFECKGRIDRLAIVDAGLLSELSTGNVLCLIDLKSSRAPGPREFEKECLKFGYHGQLAFYRDGLNQIEPADMAVCIVAVENSAPFDVVVHRFSEEFLEHGQRLYRRLLNRYAKCCLENKWPGMCPDEVNMLLLPPWGRELEQDTFEREQEAALPY